MTVWSEQRSRDVVMARSGGRCEVCGRAGDSYHHRMKEGRPWDPGNGLRLCGSGTTGCHGWVENHPGHAMRLGLWVRTDIDWTAVSAYVKPEQFARGWWFLDDLGCFTLDVDRELSTPPADVAAAVRALTTSRLVRR